MAATRDLVVRVVPEVDPDVLPALIDRCIDGMSERQLERLAGLLEAALLRRRARTGR